MATIKGKGKNLDKAMKIATANLSPMAKKKLKRQNDAQPVAAVAV